jgi:hypothetical protein
MFSRTPQVMIFFSHDYGSETLHSFLFHTVNYCRCSPVLCFLFLLQFMVLRPCAWYCVRSKSGRWIYVTFPLSYWYMLRILLTLAMTWSHNHDVQSSLQRLQGRLSRLRSSSRLRSVGHQIKLSPPDTSWQLSQRISCLKDWFVPEQIQARQGQGRSGKGQLHQPRLQLG